MCGRFFVDKAESAADKPMFRDGMAQRRCILPATNYFEWEKRADSKVKYTIRSATEGTMFMAGLCRIESSQARCTILTRPVAENIAFIHDRMPVLLSREALQDWLNPRYNAMEVIQAAVTDVAFASVEGVKQMGFGGKLDHDAYP